MWSKACRLSFRQGWLEMAPFSVGLRQLSMWQQSSCHMRCNAAWNLHKNEGLNAAYLNIPVVGPCLTLRSVCVQPLLRSQQSSWIPEWTDFLIWHLVMSIKSCRHYKRCDRPGCWQQQPCCLALDRKKTKKKKAKKITPRKRKSFYSRTGVMPWKVQLYLSRHTNCNVCRTSCKLRIQLKRLHSICNSHS